MVTLTGGMSGVYFIQAGANGPVKIGSSNDIRKRFNALQTGHYETLTLVKVISCFDANDRVEIECRLNAKFRQFYIRGEWYKCTILSFDIDALIVEIKKEIEAKHAIVKQWTNQQIIGN